MPSKHYILDDKKNVIPCGFMAWAEWFENSSGDHDRPRRVNETIVNGLRFYTVFLGLDHSWNPNPNHKPLIFETMIFHINSCLDLYCERYSTWEEAEKGHKKAVSLAKAGKIKESD